MWWRSSDAKGESLNQDNEISSLRIDAHTAPVKAVVRPPGSKSITNRLFILASLARGESVIRHPLASDDTDGVLAALEHMGVILRSEHDVLRMDGADGRYPGGGDINLGAGGTPARFMMAAAAFARLPMTVDGNARMRERPVSEGVELLRAFGVDVSYAEAEGRLPVRVLPTQTPSGGTLTVGATASSQFVSALMLIAPWTKEGLEVIFHERPTSETYLTLTARCLEQVGVHVSMNRRDGALVGIRIPSGPVASFDMHVEADASSAIYPAALAALSPGSEVVITGLPWDSVQPDLAAVKLLGTLGARVIEDHGDIRIEGGSECRGFECDCSAFPDASVMLAVLASKCSGTSRLYGLETLRVKETDRVAALATELRKFGCDVDERPAELIITPGKDPGTDVSVATYDDHRMAMAFAILGSVRGNVLIENPACAAKSHPQFWEERVRMTSDEQSGDTY